MRPDTPRLADNGAAGVNAEIRGVRRELASARDEQLARVVAVVDAMPERGEADALVAPFRERLAVLRPMRPLRFTRLLFTPLDPVIVAPASWRRGAQCIPRQTLMAFAATVRSAMGPRAEAIEIALSKLPAQPARGAAIPIAKIGKLIWPEAARILAAATVPERWRADTGLSDDDFLPIARLVSALLGVALERQIVAEQIGRDSIVSRANLSSVVTSSLSAPADIAVMATGLLLVGMPRPDLVLQAVDAQSGASANNAMSVTDRAIDFALERTKNIVADPADLLSRFRNVRAGAALLQALAARPPPGANRRTLVQQVRATVDEACRATFTDTADTQLLGTVMRLCGVASDCQVDALEQTARDLRELETIGRQLGRVSGYRDKLQTTLTYVQASESLTLADRVRLTELLADTEAAMALLKATAVRPASEVRA
jgi:hypothetical protein